MTGEVRSAVDEDEADEAAVGALDGVAGDSFGSGLEGRTEAEASLAVDELAMASSLLEEDQSLLSVATELGDHERDKAHTEQHAAQRRESARPYSAALFKHQPPLPAHTALPSLVNTIQMIAKQNAGRNRSGEMCGEKTTLEHVWGEIRPEHVD